MQKFVTLTFIGAAEAILSDAPYFYRSDRPMVVAHRGAFGHFPEHSLGSYEDAYYGGTDYIEMDLQITKDGQLAAQHDPYLDVTTDVEQYASQFADRKRAGAYHYYVADFTMEELRLLKRKQRYSDRSQLENNVFSVLSLQEVIDNVRLMNADAPRVVNADYKVGLYIELKDYTSQLEELGLDIAELTFAILDKNGLGTVSDCKDEIPIIIQSFEFDGLKKFATLSDLPRVQLASYSKDYDWTEISNLCHAVGPASDWVMNNESLTNKQLIWDKTNVDNLTSPFISSMHKMELAVHPYTLQDDKLVYRSSAFEETQLYVDKGIDGMFTEFPHATDDLFNHMGNKSGFPNVAQQFLN